MSWNCDGAKSPGPDDYSFLFFKKCWKFMKSDILGCFRDFHAGDILSKSITSYFLALVPKTKNPMGLDEYHLIY